MKNVNKKIAEIMEGRGYHKTTAYLPPTINGQYDFIYLCRGVAMDARQSYRETVIKTAIWSDNNIRDFCEVYALRTKNNAGLYDVTDWCTDKTIFDGMSGTVINATVSIKQLHPVRLPIVARVHNARQSGKFWVDIVLDPQITGERYNSNVYPDKSWTDVRLGYAVIEKVTHKTDAYAFVKGHMLKETYQIPLDAFIDKHEYDMDQIHSLRVYGYDRDQNTGAVTYTYDNNRRYVDYAVLNDDGTVLEIISQPVETTTCSDRQDGIEVTPNEFKILARFAFESIDEFIEWLDEYYGIYDSLRPVDNLRLGDSQLADYDANINVKLDEIPYANDSFKKAFNDHIVSVYKTNADPSLMVATFNTSHLHLLYTYYNRELDDIALAMKGMNKQYADKIKALIKSGKIHVNV